MMKERSMATNVEKSLPIVLSKLIGQYDLATSYTALLGLCRMIIREDSHLVG